MRPKQEKSGPAAKPVVDPWSQVQWDSWSVLMAKIQAGDEQAYRRFLDEIGPVLYNFVRRRVFNPELVPDIYQEVLLTLHKARHTYEPSRPLGPWLFTVARNSVLDALRKGRKFAEREVLSENLPETSRMETDGSLDDQLYAALQTLPDLNRQAVELLKLRGLSLEEAAKQLGVSISAVKVRAHRGYEQLRKLMLEKKK